MSVARCRREVDSAEFTDWMAYYGIEPFGEERADWRAAQMPWMFANAFKGKGPSAKLSDFMYPTDRTQSRRRQTPEEMMAVLNTAGRAFTAGKGR